MNGKRIIISLIIIMSVISIIIGVIYRSYIEKEKTFYAIVTNVNDDYILIKPLPGEKIEKKTKRIIIHTEDPYKEEDTLLITYKGEVPETDPSTINVLKIETISTKISKNKEEEKEVEEDKKDENKDISSNTETTNNNSNNNEINNNNNNSNEQKSYTEDDVVADFNNKLNEVSNYKNTSNYKEKAKEVFTNTVDFLFYDGTIKGHKFKDLSNTAKLKVLNIAFNIDDKINGVFPNYKEELSEKYKDAKEKIVTKYLELTANVCANHDAYCDKAKEAWKTIKEKANVSWKTIKKYTNVGVDKLKTWYEIYSEKTN